MFCPGPRVIFAYSRWYAVDRPKVRECPMPKVSDELGYGVVYMCLYTWAWVACHPRRSFEERNVLEGETGICSN